MASWYRYADPQAPEKTRKGQVRSEKSKDSEKVRQVEHGEVVRGTVDDGWIRLEDGSGFLVIEHAIGTLMKEQKVTSWRYADPAAPEKKRGTMVYAGMSKDSGKVGKIDHGAIVRGMPENSWLRLEDGSGFTKIVHEEMGTLLWEQSADSSAPVGAAPVGFMEQKFMAIFKHFDTDGNGKMDMDELKNLMKKLHANITDGEVEAMAAEADANKDGALDMKEFIHWVLSGQTVREIDRTEDDSGTYKKDMGMMTGAFRMLALTETFKGYDGKGSIPDSTKEKLQELWDTARKIGIDHPDDFMSRKQMAEFLQTWTLGAVKWDGERDAEQIVDDMWDAPGSGWGKATGDKALAATSRRGLRADNSTKPPRGNVIDFPIFIRYMHSLAEDAEYPDPTVDVINVMHFEDIEKDLAHYKPQVMKEKGDDDDYDW
eukprot:TRINITY_DN42123_c0_g1_i1.p1 TRINITY_DN42123_c0_g1~~TRINITY_DN42123_c0_g1_i1.p1  ORF type:complete len:429 (+),score=72.21 TRINITY_DN42123_c0_g1_i1:95-1381(+)